MASESVFTVSALLRCFCIQHEGLIFGSNDHTLSEFSDERLFLTRVWGVVRRHLNSGCRRLLIPFDDWIDSSGSIRSQFPRVLLDGVSVTTHKSLGSAKSVIIRKKWDPSEFLSWNGKRQWMRAEGDESDACKEGYGCRKGVQDERVIGLPGRHPIFSSHHLQHTQYTQHPLVQSLCLILCPSLSPAAATHTSPLLHWIQWLNESQVETVEAGEKKEPIESVTHMMTASFGSSDWNWNYMEESNRKGSLLLLSLRVCMSRFSSRRKWVMQQWKYDAGRRSGERGMKGYENKKKDASEYRRLQIVMQSSCILSSLLIQRSESFVSLKLTLPLLFSPQALLLWLATSFPSPFASSLSS